MKPARSDPAWDLGLRSTLPLLFALADAAAFVDLASLSLLLAPLRPLESSVAGTRVALLEAADEDEASSELGAGVPRPEVGAEE